MGGSSNSHKLILFSFSFLNIQYSDDWITSTFTFTVTNESQYGRYSLNVQNEVGIEISHIIITDSKLHAKQHNVKN